MGEEGARLELELRSFSFLFSEMEIDREPKEDTPEPESWEVVPEEVLWKAHQYQVKYKDLEADASSLAEGKRESERASARLCTEVEQLQQRLQQLKEEAQAVTFQEELQFAREERRQLLQEKAALESELQQLQGLLTAQELHCQLPPAPPERFLVFKGRTEEEAEEAMLDTLSVRPQIRYPLPGGTALITFESPEVAQRVLTQWEHRVQLDDWSFVHVKVAPVELWMPSSVEVILDQNPRQILLSGLQFPSLTEEQLLDKLELFFSKRQHQGGEVDVIRRLTGTGHVTVTFVDVGVAERLIKRGEFQVTFGKETSKVKVSPYLDGKISDLQLCPSVCPRTVLLSGIPDVLGEEWMREALEIHFQKSTKGGGEVEAIAYVPAGQCAIAVFEREEEGVASLSSAGSLF